MTDRKVFATDIPSDLAERIEAMAARLERPIDWVIQQALTAWIDLEEGRHHMTLEALEDVEGGDARVVALEALTLERLVQGPSVAPLLAGFAGVGLEPGRSWLA